MSRAHGCAGATISKNLIDYVYTEAWQRLVGFRICLIDYSLLPDQEKVSSAEPVTKGIGVWETGSYNHELITGENSETGKT